MGNNDVTAWHVKIEVYYPNYGTKGKLLLSRDPRKTHLISLNEPLLTDQ